MLSPQLSLSSTQVPLLHEWHGSQSVCEKHWSGVWHAAKPMAPIAENQKSRLFMNLPPLCLSLIRGVGTQVGKPGSEAHHDGKAEIGT
jgi:hypothetical protein